MPHSDNQQKLHFVTLTGPISYKSLNSDTQRPLRSLVMQSYLRQRNDPEWQFSPASISNNIKTHVTRFRTVKTQGNLKSIHRTKRRRNLESVRNHPPKLRIIASAASAASPKHDQQPTIYPVHDLDMLDPFQTLSIDLSDSETLSLLQYYHTSFWANSYACNPEGFWLSTALMDPAMIHATLGLVAIHRRDLFSYNLSQTYFKHRGEAIKLIAHRLSDPDQAVSDATIGAVAILSTSDNGFDWSSEVQKHHSRGLSRLIALRGGINSLKTNRHIQRVAAWADLLHSSLHDTRPSLDLPFSSTIGSQMAPEFVDQFNQSTGAKRISSDAGRLQILPSPVAQIIQALRELTEMKLSLLDDRDEAICKRFADLLWSLEHTIAELQDVADMEMKPFRSTDFLWSAPIVRSIGCAAIILSYSSFRDLVAPVFFYKLGSRLRLHLSTILETPDELEGGYRTTEESRSPKTSWTDILTGPGLSILLWVLYVGWNSSAYHKKNRTWFRHQIARICWQHKVMSEAVLESEIHRVVPQQALLDMRELWNAVSQIVVSKTSRME